ncbi:uncharacterized protein J8A68_005789 [[Candida] subhashii]|uniref:Uncharacterized protein n=1 Tax=[Candida] subhashii TaxID=561895 RepID=A0A8J5QBQ3_9ASCO|nr:uncharacterized protein J8A68_005789 [[Candida] subhashii]KAG7660672.1 hypothetical protein J8A68_005789 [[Candida] subhashii]
MALCSQMFTGPTKRSSCQVFRTPATKRMCITNDVDDDVAATVPKLKKSVVIYSSSDEDEDSADEQSCYNADQIRAKRRASNRISFSLNKELSRAISQYSDDDEDDEEQQQQVIQDHLNHRRSDSLRSTLLSDDEVENLDCKLATSPISNSISLMNIHQLEDEGKCFIPSTDRSARSRCFEYLVGAIDEAWARYCDATANVEDEVYGYNTPQSVATDDEEEEEEDMFDNTTDITDYEDSDYEHTTTTTVPETKQQHYTLQHPQPHKPTPAFRPRLASSSSITSVSSSKDDPSSCQLQALKDRLTKAKYYLQDLVDSEDYNEVSSFWKRWDMIKYATIELVEDDDDDEVVETTIEELEAGRLFVN